MSGAKKSREVRDGLLVNLSACKYSLVREAAERLGYQVVDDESEMWDLFWSDLSVSSDRVQRLLPFQRLNHFPGMLEICRKAALSRHMSRMAARLPSEYGFYPTSLVLPDQLDELMAALRRNKARADAAAAAAGSGAGTALSGSGDAAAAGISTFILKPSAGTQGRGIALVQYPSQLAEAGDVGSCVAQAYVNSPLLLDGFKFDLRVYALVVSVDPLRIHLYDEGLARLATEPYKPPCPSNLRAATMHLTNYAINKGATGFVSADAAPAGGGSKRPMSAVLTQLALQYGTTQEALLGSIADVVAKTVMAVHPLLAHTYHTSLSTTATAACPPACACPSLDHVCAESTDPTGACGCPPSLCFELLGFDILFDTSLQPWLLEVNHSPSFAADSRLDRAVKGEMIARAMLMLDQQLGARKEFLEAEARAQSERLYSSSSAAYSSSAHTASPASFWALGSGGRRAMSALPRSRQLQATAAALEAITANSAALLAAGFQVWGGGGNGSSGGASSATAGSRSGSYSRPASGSASDSRLYLSGGGGGGGNGAGLSAMAAAAAASLARRSLSFSGGASNGGGAGPNAGGGGVGADAAQHRFVLVFPSVKDTDRKRHLRILQTAADLFPNQRCQCPYCSRRREVSLIAMSGQQLGLAARPPSAVSCGLSGHLPVRPGTVSVRPFRTASASAATQRHPTSAGEDGGGSDTDGGALGAAEGRAYGGSPRTAAPPGGVGSGSRPPSSSSSSIRDVPRGKPPRPSCDASRSSHSRAEGYGSRTPWTAPWVQAHSTNPAKASPSQPPSVQQTPKLPSYHLPYPAPPTMASVLASSSSYSSSGSSARPAPPQRHSSTFMLGCGGGAGGGGGSLCPLVFSEQSLPGETSVGGIDTGHPLSYRSWNEASGPAGEQADPHHTPDRLHGTQGTSLDCLPDDHTGPGNGREPVGSGFGHAAFRTPDPTAEPPLLSSDNTSSGPPLPPGQQPRFIQIPSALRPLPHSHSHPPHGSSVRRQQQPLTGSSRPRCEPHPAAAAAATSGPAGAQQLHPRQPQQQHPASASSSRGSLHGGAGGGEGTGPGPRPGFGAGQGRSGGGGGGSSCAAEAEAASGRSLCGAHRGGSRGALAASQVGRVVKAPASQQPAARPQSYNRNLRTGSSSSARDTLKADGRGGGDGVGGGGNANSVQGAAGGARVAAGSVRQRGGAATISPARARRPAPRGSGRRGGASYVTAVRRASRPVAGGGSEESSDDDGADGRRGSVSDQLRRSVSCSELEAAFRGTAKSLSSSAVAAVATGSRGPAAYGSLLAASRPSAAAAALAPSSLPPSVEPSDPAHREGFGGGSTAPVEPGSGPSSGARGMPRVAYLGRSRAAVGSGGAKGMTAADLELLMVRVRTASVLSNRYVSSSSYVSYF